MGGLKRCSPKGVKGWPAGGLLGLPLPIYPGAVYITTSRAQCQEAIDALDLDYGVGSAVGRVVEGRSPTGGLVLVVSVFDGALETLVHELGHAVFMILDNAGMDPRDSNGEAFCYLQDYLFGMFRPVVEAAGRRMKRR